MVAGPPAGLGGWLFRHRGWLPVAPAVLLVVLARPVSGAAVAGAALLVAGEGLRLWAARHIGPASRTRGTTVGHLATGGPYRFTRNPLYVGNLLLWWGVALGAGRWCGVAVPLLMTAFYLPVVAWEEERLRQAHGAAYADYVRLVPRWPGLVPRLPRRAPSAGWSAALRAERGTLAVLALVLLGLGGQALRQVTP